MLTLEIFRNTGFEADNPFKSLIQPLTGIAPLDRFLPRDVQWFRNGLNFNDRVSAVRVNSDASETTDSLLYLYRDKDFSGDYIALKTDRNTETAIADLRSLAFNDRASSLLMIRRCATECSLLPINLRTVLAEEIRPFFGNTDIRDIRVELDNFPDFAPNQQLLKVQINIRSRERTVLRDRIVKSVIWLSILPSLDGRLTVRIVNSKVSISPPFGSSYLQGPARQILALNINIINERLPELLSHHFAFLTNAGYRIVESYMVHAPNQVTMGRDQFSGNTSTDDDVFLFFCLDRPFMF